MMLSLFGEVETLTPEEKRESRQAERKRKAHRAYESTSAVWKRWTYTFAVEFYLPFNTDFIFEDLTAAYESWAKDHGKPLTVEKRAFAGLQARLKRERLIEVVPGEFGRSYEGNTRPVYRSLIYRG